SNTGTGQSASAAVAPVERSDDPDTAGKPGVSVGFETIVLQSQSAGPAQREDVTSSPQGAIDVDAHALLLALDAARPAYFTRMRLRGAALATTSAGDADDSLSAALEPMAADTLATAFAEWP